MINKFFLIKSSDSSIASDIVNICKLVVLYLEEADDLCDSISDDSIINLIVEAVSRIVALKNDHSVYHEDHDSVYNRTREYLQSDLTLIRSLDEIAADMLSCSFRKNAMKDLSMSTVDEIKFYLRSDQTDFAIVPKLFYSMNNQDRILIRISTGCHCKSQIVVY